MSASPLSGGLTNDNLLVEAGGARYAVRIPGKDIGAAEPAVGIMDGPALPE